MDQLEQDVHHSVYACKVTTVLFQFDFPLSSPNLRAVTLSPCPCFCMLDTKSVSAFGLFLHELISGFSLSCSSIFSPKKRLGLCCLLQPIYKSIVHVYAFALERPVIFFERLVDCCVRDFVVCSALSAFHFAQLPVFIQLHNQLFTA